MIQILKIDIEGFGSIRALSYVWNNPGINIIQGRNGSGKTTLISALPWVLYGETLKGSVEPWALGKDYKGTKVTVYLKNGLENVTITRCREYKDKVEGMVGGNKIFLYIEGKYITSLRDKKDVQKAINRMMGVSFSLFKNSILFGQKLTRLLQETGTKQKELFDEAFNTSFINTARKSAHESFETLNDLHEKQQHAHEMLQLKLTNNLSILKHKRQERVRVVKDRDDKVADLDNKIAEVTKFITNFPTPNAANKLREETLTKKLTKFDESLLPTTSLENDSFQKSFEFTQLEAEEKALKTDIKSAVINKNSGVCSYCKQPLDSEHKKIHQTTLKRTRREKEEKLGILRERMVGLSVELGMIDQKLNNLKSVQKERDEAAKSLKLVKDEISKYDPSELKSKKLYKETLVKIRDETASMPLPKFEVKKYRLKVKHYEELLKTQGLEMAKSEKSLENYKWLINFALSNKGLKAFIFNSLLYSINQELRLFENLLGFRIEFTIDLESGNKNFQACISQGESKVQYTDLSGGEQQLVDICLALSINSAIPTSNNFNLLILDEVFESLDPSNTELVSDLLVEKAKTKHIHLVTHNLGFSCPSINKITTLASSSKGTRKVK